MYELTEFHWLMSCTTNWAIPHNTWTKYTIHIQGGNFSQTDNGQKLKTNKLLHDCDNSVASWAKHVTNDNHMWSYDRILQRWSTLLSSFQSPPNPFTFPGNSSCLLERSVHWELPWVLYQKNPTKIEIATLVTWEWLDGKGREWKLYIFSQPISLSILLLTRSTLEKSCLI